MGISFNFWDGDWDILLLCVVGEWIVVIIWGVCGGVCAFVILCVIVLSHYCYNIYVTAFCGCVKFLKIFLLSLFPYGG